MVSNKKCVTTCPANQLANLDGICKNKGEDIQKKPDFSCDLIRKNRVWMIEDLCTLDVTNIYYRGDVINVYGLYYDAGQKKYKILADPTSLTMISDVVFNISANVQSYTTVDLLGSYILNNVSFVGTLCDSC